MVTSKPAVTIKDVAVRLGLSHSTVSRALNDHPMISSETKVRVRTLAEELGYTPNFSARVMRGDTVPVYALCIPEIRNDFYASVAKAFADGCRRAEARMLLAITGDDARVEQGEISAFASSSVTGIVVTLSAAPTDVTLSLLRSMRSVQMVRRVAALDRPIVRIEEEAGCRSAVRHLASLGHRRIAYVGTDISISSGSDRVRGFESGLREAGLDPLEGGMELLPPSERSGLEGVGRLLTLANRPTALVIGTSQLTIGGLMALRAADVSVPRDMSVVSYGDPSWFGLLSPPLTAVSLPVEAMVDRAITLLADDSPSPQLPALATSLHVRGSTASPQR
jgi:LacI family transcriptional regulator